MKIGAWVSFIAEVVVLLVLVTLFYTKFWRTNNAVGAGQTPVVVAYQDVDLGVYTDSLRQLREIIAGFEPTVEYVQVVDHDTVTVQLDAVGQWVAQCEEPFSTISPGGDTMTGVVNVAAYNTVYADSSVAFFGQTRFAVNFHDLQTAHPPRTPRPLAVVTGAAVGGRSGSLIAVLDAGVCIHERYDMALFIDTYGHIGLRVGARL